jgi:hypothetical protein
VDLWGQRRAAPHSGANAWDRLRDHFDGWKVPAITANALESYAAERLREAAPATVQYELAVLRRAMSLAVKKGQLRDRAPLPARRRVTCAPTILPSSTWRSASTTLHSAGSRCPFRCPILLAFRKLQLRRILSQPGIVPELWSHRVTRGTFLSRLTWLSGAEAEPLHALTCFVLLCSADRSSGSCPQGVGFDSRRSHPPLTQSEPAAVNSAIESEDEDS